MRAQGMLAAADEQNVQRIWHFGRLIANNDMHDGNLAFRPGLRLAPVYDMLPMLYAPIRGVELPERNFTPALPMPAQVEVWRAAAEAARVFWERTARDARISEGYRRICAKNAIAVHAAMESPMATLP
jgi:hypothetical protein